jgi:hypothetical protein
LSRFTQVDFSGGLTDSPFTAATNCAEIAENVLINKDKTLRGVPGAAVFSNTANRVPTNTRIALTAPLADGFVAFSNKRVFFVTSSSITEITGTNPAFNLGSATSKVSVATIGNHIYATSDARPYPIKIWKDDSNGLHMVTAGLPIPANTPTITPSVNNSKTYNYALIYFYSYRVGTTLFEDYGPPVYKTVTSACDFTAGSHNDLSVIPVLANGADYNFDLANIKVKIYRTPNNGTEFYYVGQVSNGTTTFSDTTSDTNLLLQPSFYINGGILPNDMPPASAYVSETNGIVSWMDIIQNNEARPNRLIQAVANDADSVPDTLFTDFNNPVKGSGSVNRNRVVWTSKETYRLDGLLNEDGTGQVSRELLSSTVGLASQGSVVKTTDGVYFASVNGNGFYFTNGFQSPTKLAKRDARSSKIDAIFKTLVGTDVSASRIIGCYDSVNHRVYWAVTVNNASENNAIFVYDENQDSFTTINLQDSGIQPTSIMFDGTQVIIGDAQGYLFKMNDSIYTLPVIDTSKAASLWQTTAIISRWKSIQLGMGDNSLNKWFVNCNVQGNPDTSVDIAINSYTNGEPEFKALNPISQSVGFSWSDPQFTWGDTGFVWNRTSTLNQTRRFVAGRLRGRTRAVEFTSAYVTIQGSTSDTNSMVTINATNKTAILVAPGSYSFPVNYAGYDLIIGGVAYKILFSAVDTLTLSDPSNGLVTGTYAYTVKGKPKGQRLHLLNFSLDYEMLSDAGTYLRGGK